MANIELIRASNGSGEAVRGSVTSARASGASTLAVDSILNWPQEFIATTGDQLPDGSLDPSSALVFSGHLSGSAIEIDDVAPGYVDNGNSVGQVVLIKPTTLMVDELADVIRRAHKADGSIKQVDGADPGLVFSTAAVQPAPDPDGRITVWFEPL